MKWIHRKFWFLLSFTFIFLIISTSFFVSFLKKNLEEKKLKDKFEYLNYWKKDYHYYWQVYYYKTANNLNNIKNDIQDFNKIQNRLNFLDEYLEYLRTKTTNNGSKQLIINIWHLINEINNKKEVIKSYFRFGQKLMQHQNKLNQNNFISLKEVFLKSFYELSNLFVCNSPKNDLHQKKIHNLSLSLKKMIKVNEINRMDRNTIELFLEKEFFGQIELKSEVANYLTSTEFTDYFFRKNSFLCLTGCPSSGKTTFFKLIAKILDYKFIKFSLFKNLQKKFFITSGNWSLNFNKNKNKQYIQYLRTQLKQKLDQNLDFSFLLLDMNQIPYSFFYEFYDDLCNSFKYFMNPNFFKVKLVLNFPDQDSFTWFNYNFEAIFNDFYAKSFNMKIYAFGQINNIFRKKIVPERTNKIKNKMITFLRKNGFSFINNQFENFKISFENFFILEVTSFCINNNKVKKNDQKCSCKFINFKKIKEIVDEVINYEVNRLYGINNITKVDTIATNNVISNEKIVSILNTNFLIKKEDHYHYFQTLKKECYNLSRSLDCR